MFIFPGTDLPDAIEVSKRDCFTPWTGSEACERPGQMVSAREVAAELAPPPRLPSLLS